MKFLIAAAVFLHGFRIHILQNITQFGCRFSMCDFRIRLIPLAVQIQCCGIQSYA